MTAPSCDEPPRDAALRGRSAPEPIAAHATVVPRPDAPVFSVGEQTWSRGAVVAALDAARETSAFRHRLAREITAQTMVGDELPAGAVRAVIDALRRERRVLSRDDTDRWLAEHDLTTADLILWGEGVVARRSLSLDEIDARLEVAPRHPSDLAAREWASLVFTGRYHAGADALARGAAAWASNPATARAALGDGPQPGPHTLDLARRHFVAAAAADEPALLALVSRRQFEWIVVEGTRLVFAGEDAAAEAARSLHDGRRLDEIRAYATHGGAASIDIGSLDGPAQAAFAGAGPGDVLGPLATGPGTSVGAGAELEVWIVTGRREPSLADPITRRRAAAEHAERALQAAVTQQVRWHVDA